MISGQQTRQTHIQTLEVLNCLLVFLSKCDQHDAAIIFIYFFVLFCFLKENNYSTRACWLCIISYPMHAQEIIVKYKVENFSYNHVRQKLKHRRKHSGVKSKNKKGNPF